jgi:O-antigen/teichoic acid export membrane protein
VAGTLLVLFSESVSAVLFGTVAHAYSVRLAGIFCIVSPVQLIPFEIFRLERKAIQYVVFSLVKLGVDFSFKLLLIAVMARGIAGYYESGIVANVVVLILMLPFARKYASSTLDSSRMKELFRLGIPYIFSSLSVWALTWADRFVLNFFWGEESVGIYSLAYTLARPFDIVLYYPLKLLWFPFFFSFAAGRNVEDIKRLLRKAVIFYAIAGCAVYLAISLASGDLLRIFDIYLGAQEGYMEAAGLVVLVALAPLLYSTSGLYGTVLLYVKKPEYIALAAVIAAAVNLAMNFMLIPRYAAFGAALATALSYVLYFVLVVYWSRARFRVGHNFLSLIKVLLILVAAFIVGSYATFEGVWLSLVVRTALGLGVFALSIWFLSGVLSREEKRELISLGGSSLRRLVEAVRRGF